MRNYLFYVFVFCLMAISCNSNQSKNNEPISGEDSLTTQKNKPEVNLQIQTTKEQTFWFYNAGDFVCETQPVDASILTISRFISFDGSFVIIDQKTKYKVEDYIFHKGNVFKDDGAFEIYTITARKINEDNTLHNWPTTITIVKATNENKVKNIIKIPHFDIYGELYTLDIYTD